MAKIINKITLDSGTNIIVLELPPFTNLYASEESNISLVAIQSYGVIMAPYEANLSAKIFQKVNGVVDDTPLGTLEELITAEIGDIFPLGNVINLDNQIFFLDIHNGSVFLDKYNNASEVAYYNMTDNEAYDNFICYGPNHAAEKIIATGAEFDILSGDEITISPYTSSDGYYIENINPDDEAKAMLYRIKEKASGEVFGFLSVTKQVFDNIIFAKSEETQHH